MLQNISHFIILIILNMKEVNLVKDTFQRSNYEFNRLQYQIIDMLSKILDKHPLPKSDNNYKHIPTIEKQY